MPHGTDAAPDALNETLGPRPLGRRGDGWSAPTTSRTALRTFASMPRAPGMRRQDVLSHRDASTLPLSKADFVIDGRSHRSHNDADGSNQTEEVLERR